MLQTDGASNFGGATEKPGVVHLQCWAHTRRYFVKTERNGEKDAAGFVRAIDALSRLETIFHIHKLGTTRTQRQRGRVSIPRAGRVFELARKWREGSPMRKTAMGRAAGYLLAREKGLMECLLRPGSRIDNNLVENAIRPLKLGLKNYLFIGATPAPAAPSPACTRSWRTAASPEPTPRDSLADLIERLLDHPLSKLADFIPQNWMKLGNSKYEAQ